MYARAPTRIHRVNTHMSDHLAQACMHRALAQSRPAARDAAAAVRLANNAIVNVM